MVVCQCVDFDPVRLPAIPYQYCVDLEEDAKRRRGRQGLLRKSEALLVRKELDLNCMANAAGPMDRCYVCHGSGGMASKSSHEARRLEWMGQSDSAANSMTTVALSGDSGRSAPEL